jgi:hypothetical protein
MRERVAQPVPLASVPEVRDVVFLSKATPGDDERALWLAPKLEAAGYKVFTDIRTLEPDDRWRNVITSTLQNRACKMLLCCSNETLAAACRNANPHPNIIFFQLGFGIGRKLHL